MHSARNVEAEKLKEILATRGLSIKEVYFIRKVLPIMSLARVIVIQGLVNCPKIVNLNAGEQIDKFRKNVSMKNGHVYG